MSKDAEDSISGAANAPPIWLQADALAKSMYSAVMTDLGQTSLPSSSNIVSDPDILQEYSKNFSTIRSPRFYPEGAVNLTANIPDGTHDDLKASVSSGPLKITPSVISTKYLCSVPKMKSAGNIFMSILLADLVLLNAVWMIYCLAVERFFVRSPTANYCEGCLKGVYELQALEVIPKGTASPPTSLPLSQDDLRSVSTEYEPVQPLRAAGSESLVDRAERHDGQV